MFVFDGDEIIKYTHRLDQLHRAALPNAIRFTLNNAAFETKKLIPDFADDNFINRKPSFFKRFSGVDQARGFKIDKMKACVGMIIDPQVQATEDIEVQEIGGNINKDTIMLSGSRTTAGSLSEGADKMNRPVSRKYKGKAKPRSVYKATGKSNYARAAVQAAVKQRPMLYVDGSKEYLIEVYSVVAQLKKRRRFSGRKGGSAFARKRDLKIKSKVLTSSEKGRKLNIDKNPFVKPASMKAANQLNKFFRQNAAKQIKKFS